MSKFITPDTVNEINIRSLLIKLGLDRPSLQEVYDDCLLTTLIISEVQEALTFKRGNNG